MSDDAQQPQPPLGADPPELSSKLGFIGRIDTFVYDVEVTIVVVALSMMSLMVSTSVLYQLVFKTATELRQGGSLIGWGTLIGLLLLVVMLTLSATKYKNPMAPIGERVMVPGHLRLGSALLSVLGFIGLGFGMLHVESSTIYRIMLVLLAIPVAQALKQTGNPIKLGLLLPAVVLGFVMMGKLPEGYTWAQSYSLFLLLWVGFLGASMAARKRRHLRIDLMRKLVGEKKLPAFNALSYLLAAAFSGLICYLGYLYVFGPDSSYFKPIWEPPTWLPSSMQEQLKTPITPDAGVLDRILHVAAAPSEPGEPPDWLKVAAIPLSFGLICLRFLGHTFVFARMAARGESFSEHVEVH